MTADARIRELQGIALAMLDWPGKEPIYSPDEIAFLKTMATRTEPHTEEQLSMLDRLTARYDSEHAALRSRMHGRFFAEMVAAGNWEGAEKTAGAVLQSEPDGGAA